MATATTFQINNGVSEFRWFAGSARSRPYRSILEWAESEVVLPPGGPCAGLRYRGDRQPFAGMFLNAIHELRPEYVYLCGPSQKGKTLTGTVIPALYTLFELKESLIVGVPSGDMVNDKWKDDFKPVIDASPSLARWLPRTGVGAKDGQGIRYDFANGTSIRFMTAGGSDKSRAGKTTRVLAVTEADEFGDTGGQSKEGSKFEQLTARTNSHGSKRRVYAECTVSDEAGLVWQAYLNGTGSRCFPQCQHCGHYVEIDRVHFTGWEDAENEDEAREKAYFFCPDCGSHWSENDRKAANLAGKLVHRGQNIDENGAVAGASPSGRIFSMRFHSGHDNIGNQGDLGVEMWRASRAVDQELTERKICQFVWAYPPPVQEMSIIKLEHNMLTARQGNTERGMVPAWCDRLTFCGDVGKRFIHWVAVAWRMDGRGRVVDYGSQPVYSDQMPEQTAIVSAFDELQRSLLATGFNWLGYDERKAIKQGADERKRVDVIQFDANWNTAAVVAGCDLIRARFTPDDLRNQRAVYPYFGRGRRQEYGRVYGEVKSTGAVVKWIGNNCHLATLPERATLAMEANVDHYKLDAHASLMLPKIVNQDGSAGDFPAGAVDLFKVPTPRDHAGFVKHLLAEELQEIFEPGQRGAVQVWHVRSRANHYLDAFTSNFVAAHRMGVAAVTRTEAKQEKIAEKYQPQQKFTTADGRPFLVTQREV